jgi:glycosyltransferase involved in cell wall biosynthesis
LLNHPTLAAEMGRRGRDRVIENFSVEKMVARTERAYQEILGC